jgi:hypothetical protein
MSGYQYKTIKLIATFSKKDFSEFEKFINSPFFNERTSLIKIYVFLKDLIISESREEINIELIHNKVFPEKPYDELKTRKRLSSLNKLIERYFAQVNQQQYYSPERLYTLKEINKRGLSDVFAANMSDFRKGMTEDIFSDIACQMDYIKLLYEEYRMYKGIQDTPSALKTFKEIENLSNLINVFLYYLNTSVLLIRKFREIKFTIDTEKIHKFISENKAHTDSYKHLKLLSEFINMLEEDKIESIHSISDFILKNHNKIFYGITDFVFNLLLEYLVFKYNTGFEIDRNVYNKLIESMDKSGFIERSKIIPPMNFIAITILCTDAKENDYAGKFIKKYVSKLDEKLRINIYNSSKAILKYSEKDYDEAIELLEKNDSSESTLHIFSKVLLIQCFYEKNELKRAYMVSDALKRYLYRNKDMQELTKSAVLNYIHYVQRFISIKKNLFKKSDDILDKIYEEKVSIRKEWLISKAIEVNEEKESRG